MPARVFPPCGTYNGLCRRGDAAIRCGGEVRCRRSPPGARRAPIGTVSMPSLRTAVALTLTAAAALAPAGVAVADPAPAARGLAGTLPSTPVTDALPTRYVLGGLDAALAGG